MNYHSQRPGHGRNQYKSPRAGMPASLINVQCRFRQAKTPVIFCNGEIIIFGFKNNGSVKYVFIFPASPGGLFVMSRAVQHGVKK